MSKPLPPVLVVDDERNMCLSLESMLGDEGYEVVSAASAERAIELLGNEDSRYFAVITDARLGGMSGYDFLRRLRERWPELPAIMITAYATPKLAVEAIKSGAIDYLAKPFAPEEMLHAVSRCAERYQLLRENAALRARTPAPAGVDQIIGDSDAMAELRQLVMTVAPANATVLILGESGTGKELIAGALHSLSKRHEANYVRINCAAIPETLLESELFGHEKGAFTGALKQKRGRVEEADGGTIFLDEIGDMSRSLQAKLLRFLEDGSFTRVGGNQEHRVDVRLIAATNRDVIEAIQANEFREDLFHRLNVVQFRPPPLRERGEDVSQLAEHFLKYFAKSMGKNIVGFDPSARQRLASHHWPGNVRELRNVIERAVILESTSRIQCSSLPDFRVEARLRKGESDSTPAATAQGLDEMITQFERDVVQSALEQNQNSLTRTAEQLRLSRHALRYRMQRLNIQAQSDHDTTFQSASGSDRPRANEAIR